MTRNGVKPSTTQQQFPVLASSSRPPPGQCLPTDADPTTPIIHQQSVHSYGYDPVFFYTLGRVYIPQSHSSHFHWLYGNKAPLNFNQILIWMQNEMEKDAYKNWGTNWECAQLLLRYNSETDIEK